MKKNIILFIIGLLVTVAILFSCTVISKLVIYHGSKEVKINDKTIPGSQVIALSTDERIITGLFVNNPVAIKLIGSPTDVFKAILVNI